MSFAATFTNRQRFCTLNLRLLRRILGRVLNDNANSPGLFQSAAIRSSLAIHFVDSEEMARINSDFLHHSGPTDVITFDYGDDGAEIFICPEIAVAQSRRFRAAWQDELVRYMIHGILHLAGHDDLTPTARRKMKRQENQAVKAAQRLFSARDVGTLRGLGSQRPR